MAAQFLKVRGKQALNRDPVGCEDFVWPHDRPSRLLLSRGSREALLMLDQSISRNSLKVDLVLLGDCKASSGHKVVN